MAPSSLKFAIIRQSLYAMGHAEVSVWKHGIG